MLCDIIFGAKILPEKIRPETAKMFRIKNSDLPTINFMVKKNNDDAGSVASLVWSEELNKFQVLEDNRYSIVVARQQCLAFIIRLCVHTKFVLAKIHRTL